MARLNPDEVIISKIATDFPEGFRALFITYYEPLLRIAEKMIGVEFAEDIMQNTFLTIWNNKQSFGNVLSLESYLYTSAQNKCLSIVHTNQQFEKYKAEQSTALGKEYILDKEVISQLYRGVELLSDHCKEVMLKSMKEESIIKIALSMDTAEDTIKAYKRRTRQILKKELGDKTFILLFL